MFCKDIYQTKTDRLDHMKTKHTSKCCPYCDEWFQTAGDDLEHHIRYAHADRRGEQVRIALILLRISVAK